KSRAVYSSETWSYRILELAAVSVVLPSSTCTMVPMSTCCFVRSNLALAMVVSAWDFLLVITTGSGSVPTLGVGSVGSVGDQEDEPTCSPTSSLAPGLRDDLLGNAAGNLRVAVELHGVHRTTLGLGPQIADVAEHLRQRDES